MDDQKFLLNGRTHNYAPQRKDERCVEVSLGIDFMARAPKPLLEVGNVMVHHTKETSHTVIDLHEKNPRQKNLLNEDLLKWVPDKQYASVLCLSTVEHCNDPLTGIERLLSWADNALITIPLGYKRGTPQATTPIALDVGEAGISVSFMSRGHNGPANWKQRSWEEICADAEDGWHWHGKFHMSAEAICIIRKGLQ